jgi:uncharacterized secreted protein with C-terminal beta-propeller domain
MFTVQRWIELGALGVTLLLCGCGRPPGFCAESSAANAPMAVGNTTAAAPTTTETVAQHPTEPLTIEESDIVRLDGTWLYVMNQARGLSVIDTSTPSKPGLVARLGVLTGKSGELYVRGDHLLGLVEDSGLPCHRSIPPEYAGLPSTAVALIASPTTAPQAIVDWCVPGSLVTSRLVGDILYVVTSGGTAAPGRGWLSSLDASSPSDLRVVESLKLASTDEQVHVTDSAMFVAEYDGVATRVRYVDISSADGSLVERGSATVPGAVPSRFHLDAHNGTFRIVTRQSSATRLHVLDVTNPSNLTVLSSLENIAPGEELFATRFVEDRAYVVTYRPEVVVNQVTTSRGHDPLWVISLADPRAPRILGRLEIPGWSDYVFPRGDLLVAVGRGQDGNRVAASLFDVHDPTTPSELGRVEFGATGASSEATSDFRAVSIVETELGTPPLVLVPYSNNYGVGAACMPENHLQLVELGERQIRARGNLTLDGRVLRALPVGGALYGVTSRVVASVDTSNRDAPSTSATVTVGDPTLREECVLAPAAPTQVVTVPAPDVGHPTMVGNAGMSDQQLCGCSISGPHSSTSGSGLWLLALSLLAAGRRLKQCLFPRPKRWCARERLSPAFAAQPQIHWADGMKWLMLAFSTAVAIACSSAKRDCDLTGGLRRSAGGGATDCGHAVLGADASPVDNCVDTAFETGAAFFAQYDRHGTDSKVVFGIAGDVHGNVTFLLWDGDPSGGSGADPVITGDLCVGPSVDTSPTRDPFAAPPVTCVTTTSLGRTCG